MATGGENRRLALFPASFDPITNGHLDLIERSRAIFDDVVLGVARNVSKRAVFSGDERLAMLEAVTANMHGVSVQIFDGLVVHHAEQIGASAIIRGLRAMSALPPTPPGGRCRRVPFSAEQRDWCCAGTGNPPRSRKQRWVRRWATRNRPGGRPYVPSERDSSPDSA